MSLSTSEYGATLVSPEYKHVLEFGVWTGLSIGRIRKRLGPEYKVYGFDSFEGLPEDWVDGTGKRVGKGWKGRFTTEGQVPDIDGIKWMKGWFSDTIPEYLKEAEDIALLHVDCDLYSSTVDVLWGLNDYIKKDTVIVFDEWFYNHNSKYDDHEQKAFYEWVKEFDREYEFVDFDDKTEVNAKGKRWPVSERKIVKVTK